MQTISWQEFEMVELRVGTLVRVEPFPEARKPAYKVWADFGPELGVRKSSAQITDLYQPDDLVERQIVAVVNFPAKQIGPIQSEFLLTGFYRADGAVVLRMNAEVNRSLASPPVVEAFQKGGIASLSGTPEQFAAFIRAEIEQYAAVIRKAGITLDT